MKRSVYCVFAALRCFLAMGCDGDDHAPPPNDSEWTTDTNTWDDTDTNSSTDTDMDTDTDNDIDTDSNMDADSDTVTDTDMDTDTDTNMDAGADAGADECSGVDLWYDEASGLCWENSSSLGYMNWYRASGTHDSTCNPDTWSYCGDLDLGGYQDWRQPNIDELITLLRGCQNGTATGIPSPSLCAMTPTGCAATDSCSEASTCFQCSMGSGPAASGCYWDSALNGACSGLYTWYWSSSSKLEVTPYYAWNVAFDLGYVGCNHKTDEAYVRCVRGGP